MTAPEKPFTLRPFSLGYLIFVIIFSFVMILLAWNTTASYPPEYNELRLQYIVGLLFIIAHTQMSAQVYMWAQETVTKGQTVSHNRLSLAAFTLFLTLVLVVAWIVYCSHLILATFLLVWLSVYNMLPIYTLLKRKTIPKKWLLRGALAFLVSFLILMWFFSQSHFQVSDLSLNFSGLSEI